MLLLVFLLFLRVAVELVVPVLLLSKVRGAAEAGAGIWILLVRGAREADEIMIGEGTGAGRGIVVLVFIARSQTDRLVRSYSCC